MATSSRTLSRVGEYAVKAKTGKNWQQWFKLLDGEGAGKLDHRGIVAIVQGHGAGAWWAQMVTVGYEQERGLRVAHQTADGFKINRTKTVAAPATAVFAAFDDARIRSRWLGKDSGITVRKATAPKSVRATWSDGKTNLDVNISEKSGKTQVAVEHGKLANAKQAEKMKAYWGKALEQLKAQLEG